MEKPWAAYCKTVLLWLDVRKYRAVGCQGTAGILIWSVTQTRWVALHWYWINWRGMSFENREKLPSGLEEERFQKQALGLEDPAWPCYPDQIYPSAMPPTPTSLKWSLLHQCNCLCKDWHSLSPNESHKNWFNEVSLDLTCITEAGVFHLPGAFWKGSIAFPPEFFSSLFS